MTTPAGHPAVSSRKSSSWTWIVILGLVIAAAAVAYLVMRSRRATAAKAPIADRVVPVLVSTVELKDVPVLLHGLGSVLPIATVTVRTQIDGRIDRIFFTEGQSVKKGDLLAQIDPRPILVQLHTAQANRARDEATSKGAVVQLDRYKSLQKEGLLAQQDLDNQQALVDQLAATVKADEVAIEAARLNLDYARITSPIDGVVGVRQADQGNVAHQTDPAGIVVVTQLNPISIVFTLPEDNLPAVRDELAKGKVDVDAFSRDGSQKLASGELSVIDNQINAATATMKLKATFPNPTGVLWPSAFVKASLRLTTKKDAIVVPASVVQRGPNGTFAYVVGPDQKVQMRPLQVDTTMGETALIKSGLAKGERVVADGQNQLHPGSQIQPRKPEKPASSGDLEGSSAAPPGSGAP